MYQKIMLSVKWSINHLLNEKGDHILTHHSRKSTGVNNKINDD